MLKIKAVKKLRDFVLDVDIATDEGAIVLMGNNGAGKTTLLNMVSGLTAPDSGHIEISGRTLFDSSRRVDVPPEKRNVGCVFQNYALFPHMSVFDNLAFGLRMRKLPAREVEDKVKGQLTSVDMWDLRDERAVKLSGGQTQKVALSRALAIQPDLLILDEPLSALDVQTQAAMRSELKAIITRTKVPCIIVTHNIRDAAELGGLVYVLEKGVVTAHGKASDVLRRGQKRFIDDFFN
jgi:molybdate transport system ATP-binding protein